MKQNKAKPTLSLSLSTKSRFARNTGSPLTKDGCAPTLTATYEFGSVANMLNTKHYPRMGVGVIYETE